MKDPVRGGNFLRATVIYIVQRGASAVDSSSVEKGRMISTCRDRWKPVSRYDHVGFRIVRSR